jgi:hypothetical protein
VRLADALDVTGGEVVALVVWETALGEKYATS